MDCDNREICNTDDGRCCNVFFWGMKQIISVACLSYSWKSNGKFRTVRLGVFGTRLHPQLFWPREMDITFEHSPIFASASDEIVSGPQVLPGKRKGLALGCTNVKQMRLDKSSPVVPESQAFSVCAILIINGIGR